MQPIQPPLWPRSPYACGLYLRLYPGSSLSSLCRRDRAIRGFRLTWRPKHRGRRNIPLSCLNFATCSEDRPTPFAPPSRLSPRFPLYGSLATPTYPLRSTNNSSRATRVAFPLGLAFFLNRISHEKVRRPSKFPVARNPFLDRFCSFLKTRRELRQTQPTNDLSTKMPISDVKARGRV